ncbi:Vacuolar protein sorting-associated protein 26B [Thelohanellus kitauei]|uniref:Vacuolar protein sorting-associated protein 26B n=1 Tax=Thelohanellus kitauei TaxID=669202 RepID=A0A0C2N1D8_THEKT|nr:Vacuolar protein sorting-associated protein 26B [Thelohanellus kitauei]
MMNYFIQKINPGTLDIVVRKINPNSDQDEQNGQENQQSQKENFVEEPPFFADSDSLSCDITVRLPIHHIPIHQKRLKIKFLGIITNLIDGNVTVFSKDVKKIDEPLTITKTRTFNFDFNNVKFPYDTFHGHLFKITYEIFTRLERSNGSMTETKEITARSAPVHLSINNRIKKIAMGLSGVIGVECSLNKEEYDLTDTIVGSVKFLFVNAVIVSARVALIQLERWQHTVLGQENARTITDIEILDGDILKGEQVPFRIFLKKLEIPPTCESIESFYSIKYVLRIFVRSTTNHEFFGSLPIGIHRISKPDA